AMQSATATDAIRIIIHLAPPDLTQRQFPADSNLERRAAIVQWLQDTAVSTQFALRQELDALAADGRVSHVRPFWIVNAIFFFMPVATNQLAAATVSWLWCLRYNCARLQSSRHLVELAKAHGVFPPLPRFPGRDYAS
ncbi:hypothetical protein DC030_14670, partial [Enterococcus faecalis]